MSIDNFRYGLEEELIELQCMKYQVLSDQVYSKKSYISVIQVYNRKS